MFYEKMATRLVTLELTPEQTECIKTVFAENKWEYREIGKKIHYFYFTVMMLGIKQTNWFIHWQLVY